MLTKSAQDLVNAFHYIFQEEAELLQKYAEDIPSSGICVNIGAGTGTSAVCVLEKRPDLTKTFYTVDVNNHDNPFGGLLNERNAFDKYGMKYPNQIHGDSKEIGKSWKNRKVDFLIIDGDHSVEGISGDILNWEKNLKAGAIIFIHDYTSPKWKPVYDVVNELLMDNKEYEFIETVKTYIVFKYVGKAKK